MRAENEEFSKLYSDYKKSNDKRNRLIHASTFANENKSHLIPLISMGSEELVETLKLSVQFVLQVEKILPENLKILFWWDNVKHPGFNRYEAGNYITRADI